jgi:hypothetical protein
MIFIILGALIGVSLFATMIILGACAIAASKETTFPGPTSLVIADFQQPSMEAKRKAA